MNGILMKHKPKDTDAVKWKEHWNNQTYTLQPLADTLKEWRRELDGINPHDFDTPNHYAKMVYEAAQRQVLDRLLDLLPDGVEK